MCWLPICKRLLLSAHPGCSSEVRSSNFILLCLKHSTLWNGWCSVTSLNQHQMNLKKMMSNWIEHLILTWARITYLEFVLQKNMLWLRTDFVTPGIQFLLILLYNIFLLNKKTRLYCTLDCEGNHNYNSEVFLSKLYFHVWLFKKLYALFCTLKNCFDWSSQPSFKSKGGISRNFPQLCMIHSYIYTHTYIHIL